MSETTTCSACGAEVPTAAAFCTSCGQPVAAPSADETRIETPGLNDPTQVQPAPETPIAPILADPIVPPTPVPPPTPWGPATDPNAAVPTAPPTTAPWNPPPSRA